LSSPWLHQRLRGFYKASAGLLEASTLAEDQPRTHGVLEDAWSGDLTEAKKEQLDIQRACGSPAGISLDREASDQVAEALTHGYGGA
jgi:hypothetical protein